MKILVLTENDDCSGPMAALFLNDFNSGVEALSAGVSPAEKVANNVVGLMHECFHDLSDYKPLQFERAMLDNADNAIIIGEISIDVPSSKCIRLELPTQLACAETPGEMRALRDYVKNESFVILKRLLGKI